MVNSMSQIVDLVLADGQATPVNKTFSVQRPAAGDQSALWYDRSPGIMLGFGRVELSVRPSNGTAKAQKVRLTIAIPTLAQMGNNAAGFTPSPVVSYSRLADLTFTLPDACTLQERKDILAFVKSALSAANVVSAVTNLEPAI